MSLCSLCGGRKVGTKCPRCKRPELRQSAAKRGYGRRWQVAARVFLSRPENRMCKICGKVLAECVDHIVAHKGDMTLFWAEDNWQPACIRCNTIKSNKEERHYGPKRTAAEADGAEETGG